MFSSDAMNKLVKTLHDAHGEADNLILDISILVGVFHNSLDSYEALPTFEKNAAVIAVLLALATVVKYNRDLVEDIIRTGNISDKTYAVFKSLPNPD